jgi:antirestriction protein ArdC
MKSDDPHRQEPINSPGRKANLILDEELDTSERSGASLRHGGGDTAYYRPTLLVCPL